MPSKLFIDGFNRAIRVQESPSEIASKFRARLDGLLTLTDHQGGDVLLTASRIIDAVEDRPQVDVSGVSFSGYGVKLREFTKEDAADLGLPYSGAPGLVVVEPEDMGSVIVAVVDAVTGELEYSHHGEPEGCTRRYVKIVKLAAEAKAIIDEAAQETLAEAKAQNAVPTSVYEATLRNRYGSEYNLGQLRALSALENGSHEYAIAAAGEEFVESVEAEGGVYLVMQGNRNVDLGI